MATPPSAGAQLLRDAFRSLDKGQKMIGLKPCQERLKAGQKLGEFAVFVAICWLFRASKWRRASRLGFGVSASPRQRLRRRGLP
jgi:hypothetical protein